ncbi:DUF5985 family protein [Caulobacter segnis]|nr:DUF5985 family protein [Caulobacter segnis]
MRRAGRNLSRPPRDRDPLDLGADRTAAVAGRRIQVFRQAPRQVRTQGRGQVTPAVVYGLCLAASLLCAGLLIRAWLAARTRLLLWTAVSFGFIALNNLLLVVDLVLLPTQVQLWWPRQISLIVAIGVLIYAFIWEVDQ